MDDEQKKAAITAADQAVTGAKAALDTAKAALKTAQDAGDAAGVTKAEGDVASATQAVTDAEANRAELGEAPADAGADDLIESALGNRAPLADGTDPKKPVTVAFDKFQELNEQAKLFKQFGPVLAKLQKDPALLEKLMAGDDPSKPIEQRIAAIETKINADKRAEVTSVITRATSTWPDFRKHWDAMKPLLAGLEASGISYADAVQRAYFAVNPDAAKDGKKLIEHNAAADLENRRGAMGGFNGGTGPVIRPNADDGYPMSDSDREFALKTGIDPKLYGKHADYIKKFADL